DEDRAEGVAQAFHLLTGPKRRAAQARATLTGVKASNTHGSGNRITPTAAKASTMNGLASHGRRRTIGAAILAAVATTSPAAAAPTAPIAPCSPGRAP